jgi:hypothetical protein
MSGERERVDAYLETVNRLEPDIAFIDASAFYASAAISLKRIADALEPSKKRHAFIITDKTGVRSIGEYIGDDPMGIPMYRLPVFFK